MTRAAWIAVGLGFGDEGKGSIVDALTRRTGARVNVRFNGGPQAAHHVVAPDGRFHCFSQIGAGSFSSGVETFLSRHCFFDPLALQLEIDALRTKGVGDCAARIRIDPDCPLLTPWHGLLNCIQERSRGRDAHGSCGRGIGALFADLGAKPDETPRAGDLPHPTRLRTRLHALRDRLLAQARTIADSHPEDGEIRGWLNDMLTPGMLGFVLDRYRQLRTGDGPKLADCDWLRGRMGKGLLFEGAQGALLDMDRGYWPHVTPSRTSARNALNLLDEMGFAGECIKLGVVRAYATRHGAGPFVSEEPELAGLLPEAHNRNDGWQGAMRVGWFDAVATRQAIAINQGIDRLALTCVDRLASLPHLAVCDAYRSREKHWSALEPYLERNATGDITGLANPPAQDLALRKELTRKVGTCQPCLRALKPGPDGFPAIVEQVTGKRVDCVSLGRSALDKRWRSPRTGA